MDAKFWINAWEEGRTNFHRSQFNEKLLQFFPLLNPKKGERVLVPLCGKTKDLIWLLQSGLTVHGVELYSRPVEEFFPENHLAPVMKNQDGNFTNYSFQNLTISCGDFFKVQGSDVYDLVYDRASLVALPLEMRKEYAKVITRVLKPKGKYLLIVYEYDQSKMEGPPFSVSEDEVHKLYDHHFSIKLVESESPENEGARLSGVLSLKQKVYILEKK